MKKLVTAVSSSIPFLSLLIPTTHAATNSVNVSTSGDSNVSVNSQSSSTSKSTTTYSNNTNIHIDTNGQTYDYHSDQPGSVHIEDHNGNVTLNGQAVKGTTTNSQTPIPTMSAEMRQQILKQHFDDLKKKAASDQARMQEHAKAIEQTHLNFIQKLLNTLKSFFHLR